MTPYHQIFFPIFGFGCAIAFVSAYFASASTGWVLRGFLFVVGVSAIWATLFLGSDAGYRAWQAIPDPPPEAFSDTAPLGALVAGWIPGSVICFLFYGLCLVTRRMLHGPPSSRESVEAPAVETGNPYQPPQSADV